MGIDNGHLSGAVLRAAAIADGNLHGWIHDGEFCELVAEISKSLWGQRPVIRGVSGDFPLLRAQGYGVGSAPVVGTNFGTDRSLRVSALAMHRAGMPTLIRAEVANAVGAVVALVEHLSVPRSD